MALGICAKSGAKKLACRIAQPTVFEKLPLPGLQN